ncbi:MAG: aminotransferase class III-fold pyridoxal phosphate-dependent enzyme [bacterium]|nr:aminotransferase class III-fold pyridoxal phosphate-dependent enzyme [bacterium]
MAQNKYKKSIKLWSESAKVIVPGSSSVAKGPNLFTYGAYPIYLTTAKGATVKDADGNKYIDFQSAFGSIILGNRYKAVDEAIAKQLKRGILFSLLSSLQIDFAKLVTGMIPGAEEIRIFKTGADAVTGAIRIARAYTKRDKIVSCHFHGWHDWSYVYEKQNFGIPKNVTENVLTFTYNDLESLEKLFTKFPNEIAAVVMEAVNIEPPGTDYLQKVRSLAHRHGALLIFDEVVTGFRFARGGAQEFFKATADVSCFSKALANGMPLAMVTGSRKIFEETKEVITSSTFSEETLSLAAAIATLKEMRDKNVVEHIWELGNMFKSGYNSLAKKYEINSECVGYAPRLQLNFGDWGPNKRLKLKAYFLQETAERGILFGNVIFINYSHTERQIKKSLKVCDAVFAKLFKMKNRAITIKGNKTEELW